VSEPLAQTIALLRHLVAFDTTSRNSNLALVNWAAEHLARRGARCRMTHDDTGHKANLLASFGPEAPGGIVLAGHTDVVPIDGQDWTRDPFAVTEQSGRLFGRGTADMKGFIACCLHAASTFATLPLARPIHIALSYDEEVGCVGMPRLIDDMMANLPPPALAIVGEPTGMRLADRHRGYLGFRTTFLGHAAHSSDPTKGLNAVSAAARFVCALDELQTAPADGVARTTFNVGEISGGTNINVVPCQCHVLWEIRPAADADMPGLRRTTDGLIGQAVRRGITTETREIMVVPPLRPETNNPAIAFVRRLGRTAPLIELPFGTEAGLFQGAGIPAVICGPGSIAQAHQADEWIAIEQLAAASELLRAIGRCAAN
jgi:acetylornithine deacetylase